MDPQMGKGGRGLAEQGQASAGGARCATATVKQKNSHSPVGETLAQE